MLNLQKKNPPLNLRQGIRILGLVIQFNVISLPHPASFFPPSPLLHFLSIVTSDFHWYTFYLLVALHGEGLN